MTDFLKKHGARLKAIALTLMLIIPFFLYYAADKDALFLINFFIGMMIINMLFVMKKG